MTAQYGSFCLGFYFTQVTNVLITDSVYGIIDVQPSNLQCCIPGNNQGLKQAGGGGVTTTWRINK